MRILQFCLALLAARAAADRLAEDCEACGLVVWRMQTIVGQKQSELDALKKAKEKRAKKSTKAHSKRWLRQEYAVELAAALEERLDQLSTDQRIIAGTCNRDAHEAIDGSELRMGGLRSSHGYVDPHKCAKRVESRVSELLGESQDELTNAVIEGYGAGAACSKIVEHCTPERARWLLGPGYDEDLVDVLTLDRTAVGYKDRWTHHTDVDGSSYWFNKALMRSQREPPLGWVKKDDGEWEFNPSAALAATPDGRSTIPSKSRTKGVEVPKASMDGAQEANENEGEHWVDKAMKDWDPRKVRQDSMARAALDRLERHAPTHGNEL